MTRREVLALLLASCAPSVRPVAGSKDPPQRSCGCGADEVPTYEEPIAGACHAGCTLAG